MGYEENPFRVSFWAILVQYEPWLPIYFLMGSFFCQLVGSLHLLSNLLPNSFLTEVLSGSCWTISVEAKNQEYINALITMDRFQEKMKMITLPMTMTTLCYLEQNDSYLMMHRVKKKQDMNQDKWIGVGGHAEDYESPEDCLLREVQEETGLTLTDYRFRGIVTFAMKDAETQYMCLYTATGWTGRMKEDCPEGNLEWVRKDQIHTLDLWEGDKVFFRLLTDEGPFFSLKLYYESDELKECVLNGKNLDWKAFLNI